MTLKVAELPRSKIEVNVNQPRKSFDGIDELASSIRENGLLQPITVRPVEGGKFQVVAGERRFRAISQLDWPRVPCIVRDLEDADVYVLSIMENVARRDMNVIEEATALQNLLDTGMEPATIEQKLGLPLQNGGYVSWKVSFLKCIESVQHLLRRGQFSQTMAGQLSKLSPDGQMRALREYQEQNLTQSAFTSLVGTIWALENQIDMFPETKLDQATIDATARFRRALAVLAREAKAIEGLDVAQLAEALVADPQVDGLISGTMQLLQKAKLGLQRNRGKQVAMMGVN